MKLVLYTEFGQLKGIQSFDDNEKAQAWFVKCCKKELGCYPQPGETYRERIGPDGKSSVSLESSINVILDWGRQTVIDVLNDVETEGCQGMGTITIESINKLRRLVGYDQIEDPNTE